MMNIFIFCLVSIALVTFDEMELPDVTWRDMSQFRELFRLEF